MKITNDMRSELADAIVAMLEFEDGLFRVTEITSALIKDYRFRPWVRSGHVSAQCTRLRSNGCIKRARVWWGPVNWRFRSGVECRAGAFCYGPTSLKYAQIRAIRKDAEALNHPPIPMTLHRDFMAARQQASKVVVFKSKRKKVAA